VLTLVTPPSVEPVSLALAKVHLRVTWTDDDAYITALITAARLKCESHLSRSFITTAWQQTYDGFPGQYSRFSPGIGNFPQGNFGYGTGELYGTLPERYLAGTGAPIVINKARMIAVQSFTYLDLVGVRQTLSPSAYDVEPGDGGRITPAYLTVWPSGRVFPSSVQIAFTMGYGPLATDPPATIAEGILLYVGTLYENRESVSEVEVKELPQSIKWILNSEDWGCRA
jgi:hypothetical protein